MTSDSVGLHGLWVDLLMPLDANLDIHHAKLYTHIQTLAVKGIAGIVLFGPSGEGDAFSCDERIDAIRQLLDRGISAKDMAIHAAFPTLRDSLKLIEQAHAMGVKCFIIHPAFNNRDATDAGMVAFFSHLAQQLKGQDLLLYLASDPCAGAHDLNNRVISQLLAQHRDQFEGLIDQSHNASHTLDWMRAFEEKLSILTTQDMNAKVMANLGVHTGISSYANVIPALMIRTIMSNQASKRSVTGEAIDVDGQLLMAFDQMIMSMPAVPALKYLLSIQYRDPDWNRVRPPLSLLNSSTHDKLLKDFQKFNASAAP